MTVVIDDWHRVTDPATIGALRFLLDNLCPGLTVVVTGRNQCGLPMSWMRMQDELLEIDSAALRFDIAESENFLVELGGLDLDCSDVEELTVKTDGWIAALQLASLSLRGCEDPARLIGTMTGRHHAISEFLADNVLDTLEPSMLDFLLATSITERICGDLASALPACRAGSRCSNRSRNATCSCAGSTSNGSAITSCSSSSCGTDSHVRCPSGSPSCTASRQGGSPSIDWSAKRSITRWPPVMKSGRWRSLRRTASPWWRTPKWGH